MGSSLLRITVVALFAVILLSTAFTSFTVAQCVPAPDSAVGWWPGNGNGNDFINGNNGSLINGVTFANGKVEQAFSFNQLNQQYVDLGGAASQLLNNSEGSIAAWINQAPVAVEQFHMVTAFGSGGPGGAVGFGIDNGNVRVYHHTESFDWQTGVPVTVSTWTFITYTWDETTERLYKNGALAATRPRNFDYAPGYSRVGFGFINDPSVFFSGQIDEVAIFNRTLTAGEVTVIYNADAAGMCPNCSPAPAGVVSWWPGDGNGNDTFGPVYEDGSLMNGVAFAPGKVGAAFDLDGVNDFVAVAPSAAFDFGNGDFAIQAWIYPRTASGDHAIVSRWDIAQGYAWDFRLGWASGGGSPNSLYFFFGDNVNSGIQVSNAVTVNQWHHVAVVRRGGVLYGYLDGAEYNAGAQTGLASSPNGRLRLGNIPGYENGFFNGLIDEVSVQNTSMTGQQVQAIFNAGVSGICRDCAPAPSGLISWWPGDGNPNDTKGINNGTLMNGATFSAGNVGQAFSFDGVNDHVEIPDSPSLDLTRISMAFWFKLNELNRIHELVNKFGPEGSNTIAYGSEVGTNNKACFRISTDGTLAGLTDVCSTTVLTTGVWYHFAGTYDGTEMKIYINGVNEGTVSKTGNIFINSQNLKLGSYGYFPWFLNGYLDEVNIADRALTPAEVTAIYQAGTFGMCRSCTATIPGTLGWWRAENSGFDSFLLNNGLLVNGAGFAPGKVGQAFSLDGSDDMVVVPDTPALNFDPFEPMTIHMWAFPTENRTMHLIGKRSSCWDSGQTANYQIAQDASGLHFNSGGVSVSAGTTLAVNQWQHVAVTFDGNYVRLYLNGNQIASQETALGGINNGAPVIIGGTCIDVGVRFPGRLDEVTILNSALSSDEIAAINNAGNAGICSSTKQCAAVPPNMIASWRAEGNAYDRRKALDGSLMNDAGFDTGVSGKAFDLDGVNDYVSVPAFNMGTDWTIEGWINPARCSDSAHCTFAARSSGNFDGFTINYLGPAHPNYNEFALSMGNGSVWQVSLLSGIKYGFGRWYHVAASKSGDTYTLYVDGVAVAQQTVANVSGSYQTRALTLGTWNYGTPAYLLGRIDDVAVYDRALTAGEISSIRAAAATGLGKCAGCQTTADMDGDMFTDISIFRPSVGEWWFLRSSDGGNGAAQFGSSSDTIVPADYTGDGKTDIAFFRAGEWFILRSDDFTYYSFPFGAATDIPVPSDFDGDGTADAAVYRPATSTWFAYRSSDRGVTITTFGTAGDRPVPADYDGDGRSDVAIFRPVGGSGAEWWYLRSIDGGNRAFTFGVSTDLALPNDFTGDGKADLAFFRPTSGEWFVLRSEDYSFYSFPFGSPTDIPAPGDYDGDAIADAAVFRSSNGTWYINASSTGTVITTFGTAGDKAVPNAYVR